MTEKHFIALADTVRSAKPFVGITETPYDKGRLAQWESDKFWLADFCESQNPQFNRQRWLEYIDGKCGPSGGSK